MKEISIVGGAITGPAAALTLARNGHRVTVYEQRPADGLYSAGVLGITGGNWASLERAGVQLATAELGNKFSDFSDRRNVTESPFRLIAWVDLHTRLVTAARDAGARFLFSTHVDDPAALKADMVLDAGGIFSASRRLRSQYSGFAIYRGTSTMSMPGPWGDFAVYRFGATAAQGYLTVSQTHYGASWAMFVPRPEPMHHRTVTVAGPPDETRRLPSELRRIVTRTTGIIVSYMSDWDVPHTAHDSGYRVFTIGDANGPVRPVTTSGANLAVIVGMLAETLATGTHAEIDALQSDLLDRRRYDIALGAFLDGPEIGGAREDDAYHEHHAALFRGGER